MARSARSLTPFSAPFLAILGFLFALVLSSVSAAPTATTNDAPSRVEKRDHTANDATDVAKILEWMEGEFDGEDKFVFYSGSDTGRYMAQAFCDENEEEGFYYFWTIFDEAFTQEFGGARPADDVEVAKACSHAMAQFASGVTRVFNHKNGNLNLP